MKSLAICVLIFAVVGFATCATRHRRQADIPAEVDSPESADDFSLMNSVISWKIHSINAKADETGAVDRKEVQKCETLCFVILFRGQSCSEKNLKGIEDLYDRIAKEDAAGVVPKASADSDSSSSESDSSSSVDSDSSVDSASSESVSSESDSASSVSSVSNSASSKSDSASSVSDSVSSESDSVSDSSSTA